MIWLEDSPPITTMLFSFPMAAPKYPLNTLGFPNTKFSNFTFSSASLPNMLSTPFKKALLTKSISLFFSCTGSFTLSGKALGSY